MITETHTEGHSRGVIQWPRESPVADFQCVSRLRV